MKLSQPSEAKVLFVLYFFKISAILSGKMPAHVSYDDGDQSPLKGMEYQSLKCQWASGMDYAPYNPIFHHLSDWMKVLFSGDYQGFLRIINGKTDEETAKMISKRETLYNVSAIFHVIIGARTIGKCFLELTTN